MSVTTLKSRQHHSCARYDSRDEPIFPAPAPLAEETSTRVVIDRAAASGTPRTSWWSSMAHVGRRASVNSRTLRSLRTAGLLAETGVAPRHFSATDARLQVMSSSQLLTY